MKRILLISLISFACVSVKGQFKAEKLSVGIGYHFLSFNGDMGNKPLYQNVLNSYRSGYSISGEYRFNKYFGANLDVLFGKLAEVEKSTTRIANFQSNMFQVGGNFMFHFDNDLILPSSSNFAPYATIGIGFMSYNPKSDLMNANGETYNYWSDGTIRDLPETTANADIAKNVIRDYKYETVLGTGSSSTVVLPIGLGLKFKVSDNFQVRIASTYTLTFSDNLEGIKVGGNDKYLNSSLSIHYAFAKSKHSSENENYKDVDYTHFFKDDMDMDGVADAVDDCQGTPGDVKVDKKGCPLDTDGDGVADYIDKEVNSPAGVLVDENGNSLSEEMITTRQQMRDTAFTTRTKSFYQSPNLENLKKIEADIIAKHKANLNAKKEQIPREIREADTNNDGIIQASEITHAIDSYIDGSMDISAENLDKLINFFFEQ